MRNGLILIAGAALVTAGCGIELLGTTAIQGELNRQQMDTMQRALGHARETTADLQVQQAISAYRAEYGVYPSSLEVLVPEYLAEVPRSADGQPYGYDAATGKVFVGAAAAAAVAPTAAPGGETDFSKKQRIDAAVMRYTSDKNAYPTSLWALVPEYLPEYPQTSAGGDFPYDPQTGAVYLPQTSAPTSAVAAPQPARPRPAPVGGGPMGEVMTGISIQNELGGMSSAGSSAARSRMRGGAEAATQRHGAQQEAALNELGQ